MIYLPDTDTVNYLIKDNATVDAHYQSALASGATFALSMRVHFQVTRYLDLKGSTRLRRKYETTTANWQRVGLDESDWDAATRLWADRHRVGKPIDDADLLIAIMARKCGAVVVTNNTRHFEGLGVPIVNWAA